MAPETASDHTVETRGGTVLFTEPRVRPHEIEQRFIIDRQRRRGIERGEARVAIAVDLRGTARPLVATFRMACSRF